MQYRVFSFLLAALFVTTVTTKADPVAYSSPTTSCLSSFNPATGKVQLLAVIGSVFNNGNAFVISPNGSTAYVAESPLIVITGTIFGVNAAELTISKDGTTLYALTSGKIEVVETGINAVLRSVTIPYAASSNVAVTSEQQSVVVANQ